jgi:hypothetical protein
LSDFRWPEALVRAEAEALAAADRIVTPHGDIAALFGARAVRLPWSGDAPGESPPPRPIRCIAFPGPTIARKGAHAVREAARALDLEVALMGAGFEGDDFWDGVRTRVAKDWTGIDAVAQPALAEEQPRRLIAALAAGLPVFATAACGLPPRPGLRVVPFDDPAALIAALKAESARGASATLALARKLLFRENLNRANFGKARSQTRESPSEAFETGIWISRIFWAWIVV